MRPTPRTRTTTTWRTALTALVVPALVVTAPTELLASGGEDRAPGVTTAAPPAPHPMASRSWTRTASLRSAEPESGEEAGVTAKGTRMWSASELSSHDLPVAAERAYRRAAARLARTDPGCRLPWTLLAGVGRVESDHGRYGGARLGEDGVSRPLIFGLRLDGSGPVAAIRDTDRGRMDRDKVWDRAVGPMQFIPATWAAAARDGDGDGRRSPHDLDDAAAAAAVYLCAGSGSLADPATQAAAIYRYNQDDYYVALVQAFEVGYRTGVFVIPSPPVEEETEKRQRTRRERPSVRARTPRIRTVQTSGGQTAASSGSTQQKPGPKPAAAPAKAPAEPTPAPSPKPSAKPSPKPAPAPAPTEVTALFTVCEGGYCLGGKPLDLGQLAQSDAQAPGDLDQDGAVETNGQELDGLVGAKVTMVVVTLESGKLGILSVNGVALT